MPQTRPPASDTAWVSPEIPGIMHVRRSTAATVANHLVLHHLPPLDDTVNPTMQKRASERPTGVADISGAQMSHAIVPPTIPLRKTAVFGFTSHSEMALTARCAQLAWTKLWTEAFVRAFPPSMGDVP